MHSKTILSLPEEEITEIASVNNGKFGTLISMSALDPIGDLKFIKCDSEGYVLTRREKLQDNEVFFNLMQAYRTHPLSDQAGVQAAYEAVINYINGDMLNVCQ